MSPLISWGPQRKRVKIYESFCLSGEDANSTLMIEMEVYTGPHQQNSSRIF